MEVIETDRINIIAEKRKWQMEVENKRRQLEDDRRALQHLKSKALRERWLLDGAPSSGPEHDEVKRQLQQDEKKTRDLEDNINRLERELAVLESEGGPTITPAPIVKTELIQEVEFVPVKPQSMVSTDPEVKGHVTPRMSKPGEATAEMRRAMYSVEIRVERDNVTGETRVLSANPTLPVEPGLGVKVYEDERKVVHEMNGEDGGHILSSSEVEELIHKADEAHVKSKTITTVTAFTATASTTDTTPGSTTASASTTAITTTTEKLQEAPGETKPVDVSTVSSVEITGLEAKPEKEPSISEATEDHPVTMVFMGYQNVEDENETKRVLGLKGTVKAELVVIDDAEGKTSPVEQKAVQKSAKKATTPTVEDIPKAKETSQEKKNGEMAASSEEVRAGDAEEQAVKKKQPCKCCTIM
ncbi:paralemmin-1-like [Periophthalmus magnuspinnatus]|uniref:paralemmin-1-like n=1 Tax=Periophthalmus magnuspinnatus TaxID=409849 RepID=UPI0024369D69|nr:paralemmin-1-like [Periophthalmus magnuspinnatus]